MLSEYDYPIIIFIALGISRIKLATIRLEGTFHKMII